MKSSASDERLHAGRIKQRRIMTAWPTTRVNPKKDKPMNSGICNAPSSASKTREKPSLKRLKFEVYGEEIISKEVKQSRNNGHNGRVYLPPDWIGKQIKLIRID